MPFIGKTLEELKKELVEKEIEWEGMGRCRQLIERFYNLRENKLKVFTKRFRKIRS